MLKRKQLLDKEEAREEAEEKRMDEVLERERQLRMQARIQEIKKRKRLKAVARNGALAPSRCQPLALYGNKALATGSCFSIDDHHHRRFQLDTAAGA